MQLRKISVIISILLLTIAIPIQGNENPEIKTSILKKLQKIDRCNRLITVYIGMLIAAGWVLFSDLFFDGVVNTTAIGLIIGLMLGLYIWCVIYIAKADSRPDK